MKKVAITSGFYNPVSPGHIRCFELSRALADELVVLVNSDTQAFNKRGTMSFQPEQDRLAIISSIRYVDRAVLVFDRDQTVCETLEALIVEIQKNGNTPIWCKGGDSMAHNTPELSVCEKYGVEAIFGLGAKTHSSSEYIKRVRE